MKNRYNMLFKGFLAVLGILVLGSCMKMSEKESDAAAGVNGGFEVVKNGLPVNWLMYTPNTVPEGDFKIVIDQKEFKEGKQSLRFDVVACSSAGGRFSPGFTNEFFDSGEFRGEGTYKLSFWMKNKGSKFKVSAGGVSPKQGEMKVLIESDTDVKDWTYLEYEISLAKERHLRLELNILQPGTFWIDDIQIMKIK